ncbi:MAG: hypothetical protein ACKKMV_00385 [Candidatus Nealsonbacteria bacterium]
MLGRLTIGRFRKKLKEKSVEKLAEIFIKQIELKKKKKPKTKDDF